MVPSGLYCGMSSICAMAIRVAVKAEDQIKIAYESYAGATSRSLRDSDHV
jgi:hypothetical protein